jgi:hypothetical protein
MNLTCYYCGRYCKGRPNIGPFGEPECAECRAARAASIAAAGASA